VLGEKKGICGTVEKERETSASTENAANTFLNYSK